MWTLEGKKRDKDTCRMRKNINDDLGDSDRNTIGIRIIKVITIRIIILVQ